MTARPFVALAAVALLAASPGAAAALPAWSASPCTESSTRQVVTSFIDAFNKGDAARLDQLVADYSQYTTDAPGEFSSPSPRNRSELIAYFARRHQAHERLTLESLQFGSQPANAFNFQFELTRSADDLPAAPYTGSASVFCGNPSLTLINWGMGREPFLRSRLPIYGSAVLFLLAIVGAAVMLARRRSRGKKKPAAPAPRPEWIDV
ncbi:MAG TPA: nuclear transport factor 2 family protein [Candidatus Dormibacteraeota bacterium]|jgi:hypothetical protein|nr:nuclear transport factor 2 family protein [Candidatus Dormibacteraeota bacterium]